MDLGRIVGAFGLDGTVKVQPVTDFPERFDPGELVWLRGEPVEIVDGHWHKGQVRLQIAGVSSIESAEDLIGETLTMPKSARPKLGRNEFYHDQLVGLDVVDESGAVLGKVDEVVPAPASDLLRIGTSLIPIVKQFVVNIDLKAGRITVRLIPGMGPGDAPEEVR